MIGFAARVPASTANLGPGFDSLGLALGLYNTVVVEAPAERLEIEIEGEGAGTLPRDATNLVIRRLRPVGEAGDPPSLGFAFGWSTASPWGRGWDRRRRQFLQGLSLPILWRAANSPRKTSSGRPLKWKATPTMPRRPSSAALSW